VGTVLRLGLAAVKGVAYSHPPSIVVHSDGVVGDRRWALIQEQGSSWRVVRTVERPTIMTVRARQDTHQGLWLQLKDGRAFLVPAPDGPTVVADYWGRATLVRPAPGPWDAALSDVLGRDVRLAAVERAGGVTYADPVSLVTTSSLREAARRAGVEALDDERFRPTVVVDTPSLPPFAEENWVGTRLRVGSVDLLVRRQLVRCAVIQCEPGTGQSDGPDLLRVLATDRSTATGIVFGGGAEVLTPGRISVGDVVANRKA